MNKYEFPVGWNGIGFIKPTEDVHLHHIETWSGDGNQILMCITTVTPLVDIPVDPKASYKGRFLDVRLSLEETKALIASLQRHVDNIEKKDVDKP